MESEDIGGCEVCKKMKSGKKAEEYLVRLVDFYFPLYFKIILSLSGCGETLSVNRSCKDQRKLFQ